MKFALSVWIIELKMFMDVPNKITTINGIKITQTLSSLTFFASLPFSFQFKGFDRIRQINNWYLFLYYERSARINVLSKVNS